MTLAIFFPGNFPIYRPLVRNVNYLSQGEHMTESSAMSKAWRQSRSGWKLLNTQSSRRRRGGSMEKLLQYFVRKTLRNAVTWFMSTTAFPPSLARSFWRREPWLRGRSSSSGFQPPYPCNKKLVYLNLCYRCWLCREINCSILFYSIIWNKLKKQKNPDYI